MKFSFLIFSLLSLFNIMGYAHCDRETTKNPDFIKASGNIFIESPEMTNSGRFEINISKYDSLSMIVKGPFGIVVAKLFLTNDTAIFYNSMENFALCVNPHTYDMTNLLGFPISLIELINVFTAQPFNTMNKYEKSDSSYFTSNLHNNLIHKLKFHDKTNKIKNSKVLKDTATFFSINYNNFQLLENSSLLPQNITAEFYETKTKLEFEIDDWVIKDTPFKALNFKLPDDVKIITNPAN